MFGCTTNGVDADFGLERACATFSPRNSQGSSMPDSRSMSRSGLSPSMPAAAQHRASARAGAFSIGMVKVRRDGYRLVRCQLGSAGGSAGWRAWVDRRSLRANAFARTGVPASAVVLAELSRAWKQGKKCGTLIMKV